MKLKDQVAIITGAGRGIGAAIARQCATEGAKIALVARTESQLRAVASEIEAAAGTALVLPTDVTDHAAVISMVVRVESELGPVDLLVNNAASFVSIGPVWQTDPRQWWTDVTVNVLGVYLCCREVVAGMVERKAGRIINLIGGGVDYPFPYGSGYGTSKAAVMRFTETLADEVKEHGVIVFAMRPGLVRTAMTEYQLETEAGRRWLGRIQQLFDKGVDVPPTRAAQLAVELASGRFDRLTGRDLAVGRDLDLIEAHIPEIIEKDLYTLRIQRLPKPERITGQ